MMIIMNNITGRLRQIGVQVSIRVRENVKTGWGISQHELILRLSLSFPLSPSSVSLSTVGHLRRAYHVVDGKFNVVYKWT